jgi:hypothetical protein
MRGKSLIRFRFSGAWFVWRSAEGGREHRLTAAGVCRGRVPGACSSGCTTRSAVSVGPRAAHQHRSHAPTRLTTANGTLRSGPGHPTPARSVAGHALRWHAGAAGRRRCPLTAGAFAVAGRLESPPSVLMGSRPSPFKPPTARSPKGRGHRRRPDAPTSARQVSSSTHHHHHRSRNRRARSSTAPVGGVGGPLGQVGAAGPIESKCCATSGGMKRVSPP